MTPQPNPRAAQIAEIRARESKASKSWVVDPRGGGVVRGGPFVEYQNGSAQSQVLLATGANHIDEEQRQANCAFAAHAREDIPFLLAEIETMRRRVELLAHEMSGTVSAMSDQGQADLLRKNFMAPMFAIAGVEQSKGSESEGLSGYKTAAVACDRSPSSDEKRCEGCGVELSLYERAFTRCNECGTGKAKP
jgi:hypothetical protein